MSEAVPGEWNGFAWHAANVFELAEKTVII